MAFLYPGTNRRILPPGEVVCQLLVEVLDTLFTLVCASCFAFLHFFKVDSDTFFQTRFF